MLQHFLLTVYTLVSNHKWAELTEYFALVREILSRPQAVLTLGNPQDKSLTEQ